MEKEILDELYKSFEEIKEKPGSGKYKYVKSQDVINRINRIFKGCWSSDVVSSEIIEDNVLVCIQVCVKDNGNTFCHSGYGSSQIARFIFGDNKGKAINIGNNYNAAKSLAIKDAVKKWGIALYIEDTPDEEAGSVGIDLSSIPEVESAADLPIIPIGDKTDAGWVAGLTAIPVGTGVVTEEPELSILKKELLASKFTPPPFPDSPTQTFPNVPGVIKEPATPEFTPPVESSVSITQETAVDKITDVQKVAIQGLLQLKGLDYKELLVNALGRTDNLPVRSEDLTYSEAVLVIKYGNDVGRK